MLVDSNSVSLLGGATAVKTWYGMSDTQWHIDATRHQNEEYLQTSVDGIRTWTYLLSDTFKFVR